MRLVREHVGTQKVNCLGRGEGAEVLAGLADGQICRINPDTLGLTEVAKLPASPQWISWLSARRTTVPPAWS